ncbi:hypothetical protein AVEN_128036-1 [Araneus ventricosus]|uniref:Uncharacterized protein n=1 Tax=Araneus ventricosus TaxID=182803 RepID=A0A4Y1ZZC1_ARAVE|nr:hypothetical protein AVEN_128036-1 [Araneus ventricosus]
MLCSIKWTFIPKIEYEARINPICYVHLATDQSESDFQGSPNVQECHVYNRSIRFQCNTSTIERKVEQTPLLLYKIEFEEEPIKNSGASTFSIHS